jgi:hypothetical protein
MSRIDSLLPSSRIDHWSITGVSQSTRTHPLNSGALRDRGRFLDIGIQVDLIPSPGLERRYLGWTVVAALLALAFSWLDPARADAGREAPHA